MEYLIAAIITVIAGAIAGTCIKAKAIAAQHKQEWLKENCQCCFDSSQDWAAPDNRRQSSRWADMSEAERRAKFESECG